VRRTIRGPPATCASKMSGLFPNSPSVVGTIHSHAALKEALRLKPGAVDLLEVRVDHFVADLEPLRRAVYKLGAPLIITVRHPQEGGAGPLTAAERRALYLEFLPSAAFIDFEQRSSAFLRDLLPAARKAGVGLILSHHRFDTTPSLSYLASRCRAARNLGAAIFKVATLTQTPADLATLLSFLTNGKQAPRLSVMGMGTFGKISRLTLARAGSVLNYGYLGEPQVSGQWPAVLLKQRLLELSDG